MKWAPIIPLIGGFPLGAFMATGKKPHAIYSYSAFAKNDQHLVEYWKDVPYYHLDDEEQTVPSTQLDLMVATPPCAGLSMLNTGPKTSAKGSGSCAVQNEWMYRSTVDAIDRFSPKVIIGENAPTLYTKMGEGVAENLYEIAQSKGYALTLYKTNTIYHGLPQRRERCFYFLFKADTSPLISFYQREPAANFENYLKQIPADATHQDLIIREDIMNEPYYKFLQHKFGKDDVRNIILEKAYTAHAFVVKSNLMEEFVNWAELNHQKGYELGTHALKKFADGKGVWDGSVHVFRDHMNAVIGRALAESIHPNKNRSLNIREALHMMGFPSDFQLQGGKKNRNHIAQNVPTCTARDMVYEAIKFMNGELQMTDVNMLKLNNNTKKVDTEIHTGSTLETFFG